MFAELKIIGDERWIFRFFANLPRALAESI